MISMDDDPFHCSECGADVSPNATGCRCGAQKNGGRWLASETYDGVDLPDDDFDYEQFVENEFGGGSSRKSIRDYFWWLVGVVLLILLALGVIGF